MITEHLHGAQEAFPVFSSFPVLLWHAFPRVGAHVMGTAHGKGWREEEEILLPCPLIVFSVLSVSSPTLGEYPCIPGNRVGEGHMSSLLPLIFGDYCYTQSVLAEGHHRCPDLNICLLFILLFIISPLVCYASSLCLSKTHKHTLKHEQQPLFLPFTRNIQLCLFSKAPLS